MSARLLFWASHTLTPFSGRLFTPSELRGCMDFLMSGIFLDCLTIRTLVLIGQSLDSHT
jgi:hypothetical protein